MYFCIHVRRKGRKVIIIIHIILWSFLDLEMALVDTEQTTPLEEISKLYSSEANIIEKICKKWADRTKHDATPWPTQGSCDPKLILQMEGKIYSMITSIKIPVKKWKPKESKSYTFLEHS